MDVTLHAELGEIDALGAHGWRDLADKDPHATIFQTPDYAHVWWEEFGALRQLVLMEFTQGDDLKGIAPMSLEPDGSLRFVGDPAVSDYLGPVSRVEDRDAISHAIVEAAQTLDGFERFWLAGLDSTSGWPEAFSRVTEAVIEPEDVCPRITLGGTYDDYLMSLGGKLRHEIRRKERRLREGAGFETRLSTAGTIEEDLDAFFDMHRSSTGPKGKFMNEDMASYFRRFAGAMLRRDWLRMAILESKGEPVAGTFGFSRNGVWSVYNSSYDHAHRDLSVGMVLVGECIRLATEEGCATFDFLRGSEEYKYRFGATDHEVVRLEAKPA